MIEVLPIGAEVIIGPASNGVQKAIPGIVIGISIRGRENKIQYEVGWWDNYEYKTQWFEDFQVEVKPNKYYMQKIGFKSD